MMMMIMIMMMGNRALRKMFGTKRKEVKEAG
jgi:hypothetical protein